MFTSRCVRIWIGRTRAISSGASRLVPASRVGANGSHRAVSPAQGTGTVSSTRATSDLGGEPFGFRLVRWHDAVAQHLERDAP